MTESEKVKDWQRYFSVVPKISTLMAIERNDGQKLLERFLREAGLVSALDVIKACKGDAW
jgi:hypothetical protein